MMELKGKLSVTSMSSASVYKSETWTMNAKQIGRFVLNEMRMLRWVCNLSVTDNIPSVELRERFNG